MPYDSACATFQRWGQTGYAVSTAPLNIAHINRRFARVQRDRVAIKSASDRLRMLGIPAADANMSSIADDLYADVISDFNS